MSVIFKSIQYLTQPIFLFALGTFILVLWNPYVFGASQWQDQLPFLALVTFSSVLIPCIGLLVMRGLNMIENFEIPGRERIGALLFIAVIYSALYFNIKQLQQLPSTFLMLSATSMILVYLFFVLSIFENVSLRAGSIIALTTYFFILALSSRLNPITFDFGQVAIEIHSFGLVLGLIIVSGFVLSSTLYLFNSSWKSVGLGVASGLLAPLIAYFIYT